MIPGRPDGSHDDCDASVYQALKLALNRAPGNADGEAHELLDARLAALRQGPTTTACRRLDPLARDHVITDNEFSALLASAIWVAIPATKHASHPVKSRSRSRTPRMARLKSLRSRS